MADLVTLQEAKDHLRIKTEDEDPDVYLKLQAAEAIVLSHLTQRDDGSFDTEKASWTEADVPLAVKHAILIQLGELFVYRGDDTSVERTMNGRLSPVVESLLMAYKDPGMA